MKKQEWPPASAGKRQKAHTSIIKVGCSFFVGFVFVFCVFLREGLGKMPPPLEIKKGCLENWRGLSVNTETGDESE